MTFWRQLYTKVWVIKTYMKTQTHSTQADHLYRLKLYIDSCYPSTKTSTFATFAEVTPLKTKDHLKTKTYSPLSLPVAQATFILLLFWDAWLKTKTLRRTKGRAEGNCQVCTMLAPSWGEGAKLLHCNYKKPQWEPDCRLNLMLNNVHVHTQRKRKQGFALVVDPGNLQQNRGIHAEGTSACCSQFISCPHSYVQKKVTLGSVNCRF